MGSPAAGAGGVTALCAELGGRRGGSGLSEAAGLELVALCGAPGGEGSGGAGESERDNNSGTGEASSSRRRKLQSSTPRPAVVNEVASDGSSTVSVIAYDAAGSASTVTFAPGGVTLPALTALYTVELPVEADGAVCLNDGDMLYWPQLRFPALGLGPPRSVASPPVAVTWELEVSGDSAGKLSAEWVEAEQAVRLTSLVRQNTGQTAWSDTATVSITATTAAGTSASVNLVVALRDAPKASDGALGAYLGAPRTMPGSAFLRGRLFVIAAVGGDNREFSEATMEEYDFVRGSWRTLPAALPRRYVKGVSVAVQSQGLIYHFANAAYGPNNTNGLFVFDPETMAWERLPVATALPGPLPYDSITFAAEGTDLYVIGGYAGGAQDGVHKYDTVARTWSQVASFPDGGVYWGAAVGWGGKVIHTGGTSAFRKTWAYDPPTDTWTHIADVPASLDQHSRGKAAVIGDTMYWSDGKVVHSLDLTQTPGGEWESVGGVAIGAVGYPGFAAAYGRIYVLGAAGPSLHPLEKTYVF